ncbi:hypothetical protein ACE41H_15175 [Paenibacillus enshidis]|uniref:Uncharacterized protein n=1 Tax=Paenibacillus enshidis TaxID=1458439 RepID=A0ABV5AV87_9BACL
MKTLEEYYERLLKENDRLHRIDLDKHQEIADLRNEIKWLKEQLSGNTMTEREELLLRVAKVIVRELDK